MTKGRTLFEILSGRGKEPPPAGPYNPLGARVGQSAQVDVLDYRDELWAVAEVWSWDTRTGRAHHPMADYVLASDGRRCLLRCVPRVGPAGPPVGVLLMTQYWPDGPGPAGWGDETPAVLAALNDESGEFYRYRGTPEEERYWRLGGAVPITAEAHWSASPDLRVGIGPPSPYTYWDYSRVTRDEGGGVTQQFLYAQLSGRFAAPDRVEGGDKTLVMYRGVEVDPSRITLYGAKL